jgi:hypothetical protein
MVTMTSPFLTAAPSRNGQRRDLAEHLGGDLHLDLGLDLAGGGHELDDGLRHGLLGRDGDALSAGALLGDAQGDKDAQEHHGADQVPFELRLLARLGDRRSGNVSGREGCGHGWSIHG